MDAALQDVETQTVRAERRRWIAAFLVMPVLALAIVCGTLRIWRVDLDIPFEYGNDGLMALLPVKTMLDEGWWLTHERLGAPDRLEWHDFPVNPNIHFAILKVMSFAERNPFRLLNYYVLLSFPLAAVCALAALKSLRLPVVPAMFGALIFAFAPYHFWRGFAHPWLSSCFTIPLGMIVVAWVLQDRRGLLFDASDKSAWKARLFSWPTLAAVLCCAALGFDFPYYPVFICFLLLIAGPYVALKLGSWRPAARAAVLIGLTAGFFTVNLLPNILYRLENGPNLSPTAHVVRGWNAAEASGLKIASLLMPAKEHPIPAFEALRAEYQAGTVVKSSEDSMALGTIAALGFLSLLAWILFRLHRGRGHAAQIMDSISVLNLACVLLSTVGGLGAVANLLSLRAMRCYDRISIVIMFLAIVPVCLLLAALQQRVSGRRGAVLAYGTLVGLLLVGGIWEQSRYFRMQHKVQVASFESDREFIRRVEQTIGPDASIFQFPVQHFLSNVGPAIHIEPYSHFRGVLHSDTLTWSTGASDGRRGAMIQSWIESQPVERRVEAIGILGFDAIYVDRRIFPTSYVEFEQQLRELTGSEPIVSQDGLLSVFPMEQYLAGLHARYTPAELEIARNEIMRPVRMHLVGFDPEERYSNERFRWCLSQEGSLKVANPKDEPVVVEVSFSAATASGEPASLHLEGPSFSEEHPIGATPSEPIVRRISVPPGEHAITFRTDAKPLVLPQRTLVFRLKDFDYQLETPTRTALR